MQIKQPIVPSKQRFAKLKTAHELHYEAICVFVATGFFMDDDTYYKDQICLLPGHDYTLDNDGFVTSCSKWFDWHYNPSADSFEQVLETYVGLLTQIIQSQSQDTSVILPLSGGLDSRSQALVLKNLNLPVQAYSYYFKGGYPEHKISEQIAKHCGFDFKAFEISEGYLWHCIDDLAQINHCYSEFTHPRQMAVLKDLQRMNGEFSLGHWGDVFFDKGAPEETTNAGITRLLFKKMVKNDGLALAEKLWEHWGLQGHFKEYLVGRIETALSKIAIDNVSAKVRAFKTSQWAHRWTTTNLSVFEEAHPIHLPYYDNRMCEFICRVPERYLADRKLQIAHLKQDKALSQITWHAHKPFNIHTYPYNKPPYNLPYRVLNKLKRETNALLGRPYIQRNFELQLKGPANDAHLRKYLYSSAFKQFIPESITKPVHEGFLGKDYVGHSHSVSMLLTLALWQKHFYTEKRP